MFRFLLACAAAVLLSEAAHAQTCYGGSPQGYSYRNGYSNGYSRSYSFGSYGLPPAELSYGNGYARGYSFAPPPPAIYESRTPYFAEPARYSAPPAREYAYAPQRFSFEQRGLLGRPRTRVTYQGGGFCPGGY